MTTNAADQPHSNTVLNNNTRITPHIRDTRAYLLLSTRIFEDPVLESEQFLRQILFDEL